MYCNQQVSAIVVVVDDQHNTKQRHYAKIITSAKCQSSHAISCGSQTQNCMRFICLQKKIPRADFNSSTRK